VCFVLDCSPYPLHRFSSLLTQGSRRDEQPRVPQTSWRIAGCCGRKPTVAEQGRAWCRAMVASRWPVAPPCCTRPGTHILCALEPSWALTRKQQTMRYTSPLSTWSPQDININCYNRKQRQPRASSSVHFPPSLSFIYPLSKLSTHTSPQGSSSRQLANDD
jgi:hypothetical protein